MSHRGPRLSPAAITLIGATVLLGAGVIAVAAAQVPMWSPSDTLAFVALTLGVAIAEQFSIPLRHGTETVNFSLTDALWAAALPLLARQPSVLIVAVAAGVLLGHVANRRAAPKVAFNVGQFAIGIGAAEALFLWLGYTDMRQTETWLAIAASMSAYFVINANLVALVISIVERKPFLAVFLPSSAINVLHWAGNTALGILAAIVWTTNRAGLLLLVIPMVMSYLAYRQWIRTVRERNQMRDLYEAGRVLAGPLEAGGDFAPFVEVLQKMLEAESVEVVVVDENAITVHGSRGTRRLTAAGDRNAPPLEAFVRVHKGLSPQIALIGGPDDAKGVVAVYRDRALTATERALLEALASQISVRLSNHKLFFQAFQQAQLAEIVEHTSDGIFVISYDGRIVSWNPAMERISGRTRNEAVGYRVDEIVDAATMENGLSWALDPAHASGEARDAVLTTKEGERRWIRHTVTPIRDRDGAHGGCVVVAQDVTAQVQAEQMKKDFVAMVSHELRTPLTPLKGFLATLLEGTAEESPEARREYYRIMLRQADRLERLIMDLLDVSQMESGTLVVEVRPVEVTSLVSEQVAEFREQNPRRRIDLATASGQVLARADAFRIQQVVANLVSNALKYSPPESPVEVSVATVGKEATVSVTDHGPGILLPDPDRVFDRFYRAEPAGRKVGGTGLGLYIARQLVEAMGGRLWLVSRPGAGSTFSFSLPRADVVAIVDPRRNANGHVDKPKPSVPMRAV
jgi:PAS domain S-box-containing protein